MRSPACGVGSGHPEPGPGHTGRGCTGAVASRAIGAPGGVVTVTVTGSIVRPGTGAYPKPGPGPGIRTAPHAAPGSPVDGHGMALVVPDGSSVTSCSWQPHDPHTRRCTSGTRSAIAASTATPNPRSGADSPELDRL